MLILKTLMKTSVAVAMTGVMMGCLGGSGGGGSGSSSGSSVYYAYDSVYSDVCDSYDILSSCYSSPDYDYSYSDYDTGYTDGYYDGYDDGYTDGYYDGYGYYDHYYSDPYLNAGDSSDATDTNFSAINSDANKKIIQKAADKLVQEYGFNNERATAVASALNAWSVARVERGHTTAKDIQVTFQRVFGVSQTDALAAVKSFITGDKAPIQDLTARSSSVLGLKPNQTQKFFKGMYKKALAEWGYDDVDSLSW